MNWAQKLPGLKWPIKCQYQLFFFYIYINEGFLPCSQQSNEDDPAAQLSVPHTRSPAQWESESQSPSPRLQGEEEEQQDWSSFEGLQGDNVDDPPPPAETIVGK